MSVMVGKHRNTREGWYTVTESLNLEGVVLNVLHLMVNRERKPKKPATEVQSSQKSLLHGWSSPEVV